MRLFLELRKRFQTQYPDEKFSVLLAVKLRDEGTGAWEDEIELYAGPIEYRCTLEAKNQHLGSLARRYVTSEGGLDPFLGLHAP
jgi:hypothetical protein